MLVVINHLEQMENQKELIGEGKFSLSASAHFLYMKVNNSIWEILPSKPLQDSPPQDTWQLWHDIVDRVLDWDLGNPDLTLMETHQVTFDHHSCSVTYFTGLLQE